MSAELIVSDPRGHAPVLPRAEARPRFFFWMSVVLLLFVFGGFAQTLFLRPLFDVPEIPWSLVGHGILMTAWYALLVTQTGLVAAHRTDLHRRLGIATAVVALALIVVNANVVLGFPARVAAGQYSLDFDFESNPEAVHQVFWTDFATLLAFAVMVSLALVLRRRPGAHKRLMLLASIAILGPAYSRIANLMLPSVALYAVVSLGAFVGLHLALVIYDARTMARRFHPATLIVVVGVIVATIVQTLIRTSELGRAIVTTLAERS